MVKDDTIESEKEVPSYPILEGHKTKDEQLQIDASFSVLSLSEKYLVLILVSVIGFCSAVSAPIYFPALQVIEKYFNISEELVNISIVVYLAAQSISPTIFASVADKYGRRPLLLVCLIGFIGTCIGLALCNSYAAILALRVFQSTFIAPSIAISAGATGDFTERHERGGFVGLQSGIILLGQGFGSLIGAGLTSGFGWRAIFWFLAIFAGVTLVICIIILPETARNLVGNGSILPRNLLNRAPIIYTAKIQQNWHLNDPDYGTLVKKKSKIDFLTPFKIMSRLEIAISLFSQAIHYTMWTLALTSITTQLTKEYHYSVIKIGLCYLPSGILGMLGSVFSGKVLDWNYKREYRNFEYKMASGKIPATTPFNIIGARVQVAVPFIIMSDGAILMFGWCIDKHIHISTILVSSGIMAFGIMAVVGVNTTLMIDMNPDNGSAATSCVNFTRCGLAAIFVGVLTNMNKAMGIGGTFSLMFGLGLLSCALLYIPLEYGMKWTLERKQKEIAEKKETHSD
jgi:MFS family permease